MVKKMRKLECKCHGISGSCAMRTCWRELRDFRRVGTYLKNKYNGAVQVSMSQNAGQTELIVANKNHKKPTKFDLVYFDKSPDYCVEDLRLGNTLFSHLSSYILRSKQSVCIFLTPQQNDNYKRSL